MRTATRRRPAFGFDIRPGRVLLSPASRHDPATDVTQPPENLTLTRHQRRLVEASALIQAVRPERIDFLHTVQCQCGIPYKNPGDLVREWDRKQGNAVLRIEAGAAIDPRSGQFVKLGLPFGEKPRLVLIHLASEAVGNGSPVVDVEDSMTAFARSLGMETNGQQLKALKDQLARLASSTVRMGIVEEGRAVQVNTQIVTAFDLWFPKQPDQRVLWPSTVRLSDEFYQSLGRHAVPLDHRAVAALAGSSMALDVYVWLAQRLHRVPPRTAAVHPLGRRLRPVRPGLRPRPRLPPPLPPDARPGQGRLPVGVPRRRRAGADPGTQPAARRPAPGRPVPRPETAR
jgi:hypothetical protein